MKWCTTRAVPPTHPSIPGHFPGHPVVPGVVLLETVLAVMREFSPDFVVARIPRAKFFRAVKPGANFEIEIDDSDNRIRFECRDADGVIASGIFEQRVQP